MPGYFLQVPTEPTPERQSLFESHRQRRFALKELVGVSHLSDSDVSSLAHLVVQSRRAGGVGAAVRKRLLHICFERVEAIIRQLSVVWCGKVTKPVAVSGQPAGGNMSA